MLTGSASRWAAPASKTGSASTKWYVRFMKPQQHTHITTDIVVGEFDATGRQSINVGRLYASCVVLVAEFVVPLQDRER